MEAKTDVLMPVKILEGEWSVEADSFIFHHRCMFR